MILPSSSSCSIPSSSSFVAASLGLDGGILSCSELIPKLCR